MSEPEPRNAKDALRALWSRQTSSYKARLERKPTVHPDMDATTVELPDTADGHVQTLRVLIGRAQNEGAAFQSVAVAALQILERVLRYEREAARAALSLGQCEKMKSMVSTAEDTYRTLRGTLSSQGAKVKDLCAQQESNAPSQDQSWWFVLSDALEVLEKGADQMKSLATAQPESSPAHALSRHLALLLGQHHDELLLEAEHWIA